MTDDLRFKIASSNVVYEIIEGEVLLINLSKGHYYSLVDAAVDIWQGIIQGLSVKGIKQALAARYDVLTEDIEKDVEAFIKQLEEQALVLVDKGALLKDMANTNALDPAGTGIKKLEYKAPLLQKYTDMEEILLLDPIHDVDATGWPNVRKEQADIDR